MALEELVHKVMLLEIEERRHVFFTLVHDPELKINPFHATNVRQNGELALQLESGLKGDRNVTSRIA